MIVPSAFAVLGTAILASSPPTPWASSASGSGPTTVQVWNPDGNGKLAVGDWVDFRVTARGQQQGTFGWTADIFQNNDCTGTPSLAPITVSMTVSAAPATPSPVPTPTIQPTPAATSSPSPRPSNPTPRPTATPAGSEPPEPSQAAGASAQGSSTPGASATPGASGATASSSAAPASAVAGPSAAAPGPASLSFAETADAIGDSDILASVGLGFQSLGLLGDGYAWLVPGLVAGVPGLLLLLLVLGQVVLGVGWLPNAGRLLGPEPPALPDQEHLWWAAGRPIEG